MDHMLPCIIALSAASPGFSDHNIIPAECGQSITLPCQAANSNKAIVAAEWRRADLQPEYVICYRDEQYDPDYQHPSFVNRVDLQDRQMKDGDLSLVLKDVAINDTGTYECHVTQTEGELMMLINSIYLRVDPPGEPGGSVGLIAGLSVLAVLAAAVAAVFMIYRCKNKPPYQTPAEQMPI